MATLTLATVRTNAYNEVHDILQTTNAISTDNIHPSYNNNQTIKEGYPQVIVNEPRSSWTKKTMGGSNSTATKLYMIPFTIAIDVYHNSASNAKTLTDEVTEKLIGSRETLRTKGIFDIEFDDDDIDVTEYKQHKSIHKYTVNFNAIFYATG